MDLFLSDNSLWIGDSRSPHLMTPFFEEFPVPFVQKYPTTGCFADLHQCLGGWDQIYWVHLCTILMKSGLADWQLFLKLESQFEPLKMYSIYI